MTSVDFLDVAGRRRTFLLTDVVESTRLWELHPNSMEDALVAHDRLIADAVVCHGGDLIKSKGEGDSTFSVFAKPSEAATAALAAQDALAVQSWPDGAVLRVRMAIHVGEAIEREGDFFGPTVNRAARLRGVAGPAEIVVSQAVADGIVRSLADDVELLALGPRELRGLSRPEQAYLLRRAAHDVRAGEGTASRVHAFTAFPEELARARLRIFVDRDDELGIVSSVAQESVSESHMLLVGGEPGVGKTRLVAEAAARLFERGWTVVCGRAEADVDVPHAPLVEVLRPLIEGCPPGILTALPAREVAALELLVPELRDRVPGLAGRTGRETERDLLMRAVPRFLTACASITPLAVVLDDLHNADLPALVLFRQIAGVGVGPGLFVLGTYRSTELGARHPLGQLLADLHGVPSVTQMSLHGLSAPNVRGFLEAAGYQSDARTKALADALHAETDGNPLFVAELLAHLAETGVAYQADGFWLTDVWDATDLQLPASDRAVLNSRLDRMSDDANRLVEIGAVIGREFPFWLVSQVVSRGQPSGDDELFDSLDEAVDAGLVLDNGDGTFAFTHALMRQAILGRLSSARRAHLHLRAAEVLSLVIDARLDEPTRLALLAHHYRQAGPSASADAVGCACAAGDAALSQLAFEDAAAFYNQAFDATPDLPTNAERRIELMLSLGECRWRAGEFGAADSAFRRAQDLAAARGLTDLEARAALALGGRSGHRLAVAGDPLVDRLRQVRSRTPPPSPALFALVTARLAEALTLEPREQNDETSPTLAVEAVERARAASDDATLASVLLRAAYAQWTPDNSDSRLADLTETIGLAERLDDPDLNVSARILRCATLDELAMTGDARQEWGRVTDLAKQRGDAYSGWLVATVNASRSVSTLALDHAEEAVWDALALGRRANNPSALQLFGTQMFAIRREQGRLHELHAATLAMVERHPNLAFSRAVLALLYAEIGIRTRARRELGRLAGATRDFSHVPRDVLWLGAAGLLAETCAILQDRALAAPLYEQLQPYADRLPLLGLHGPNLGALARQLGLLAALLDDTDNARAHLSEAIKINDRVEARSAAARSRLALARLLVREERAYAHELIAQVLDEAHRLGLTRLGSEARELSETTEPHPPGRSTKSTRKPARQTFDFARAVITSRGRTIMGRLLANATDEELQRRFGTQRALQALFHGMTRGFQPAMAFGFEGDITFELLNTIGLEGQPRASWWTVSIKRAKATAHSGASEAPAASIRLSTPNFIKMLTGTQSAVAIFEQGAVEMDGDVLVIARLTEMFGGITPLPSADWQPATHQSPSGLLSFRQHPRFPA